ncbi:MAG: Hsp20/alpha crystallin family protein [Sporolactobacillus sp.]
MANLYPTKKDRDGFFDFLPSWFDEWGHNFLRNAGIQSFAADVAENDASYTVKIDLPGFSKDNIHLDFKENVLTISASREQETNERTENGSFIRRERASGAFTRRFMLEKVDEKAIKAQFKDGVLTVTLPKREEQKVDSNTISID